MPPKTSPKRAPPPRILLAAPSPAASSRLIAAKQKRSTMNKQHARKCIEHAASTFSLRLLLALSLCSPVWLSKASAQAIQQAESLSAQRAVYDNDEIFEQLSGA